VITSYLFRSEHQHIHLHNCSCNDLLHHCKFQNWDKEYLNIHHNLKCKSGDTGVSWVACFSNFSVCSKRFESNIVQNEPMLFQFNDFCPVATRVNCMAMLAIGYQHNLPKIDIFWHFRKIMWQIFHPSS
jgi:hypothetical protein